MINKIGGAAIRLFDTSYVLRFILRLFAFYLLFRLINWGMIGVIVPGGSYSYFIDHYLNYVTVLKVSLLQVASWMGYLLGVSSQLLDNSTIQITDTVVGSNKLIMAWSCVGLEILSFWAAFVLADSTSVRKKIYWLIGGVLAICFINCARIALLLLAIKGNWQEIGTLRHHDTFNIVAYAFVFLLMFIYYKKNKKELGY